MRGSQWLVYVVGMATCLPAHGWAQISSTPAAGGLPTAAANDAWLQQVRALYSSTARDGLHGFVCHVQPDWRTLISTANKGTVDALGERKIAALSGVQVTLHAQMDGTSTIDIDAPTPPADIADPIQTMIGGTKQALGGFVQVWALFANESVIPNNLQGVDVTTTPDGGRILQASDDGTNVTETFGGDNVMREYDVVMPNVTARFTPTFSPSSRGLQITGFLGHYQPQGSPDQVMQVSVGYNQVDGFTLPSEIDVTLAGSGTLDFALSECKANP